MGKYGSRLKKTSMPKRDKVNPYMRGIGCMLMIIVPVFAYGVGDMLADQRFGYQVIPPAWFDRMTFPPIVNALPGLKTVTDSLGDIPHLPATLALAAERGALQTGQKAALLGIGSGLNSLMLAVEW